MHHDHDLEDWALENHADRVLAAAVSSDGTFGATTSRSGEVRIWRLPGGRFSGGRLVAAVSGPHHGPVRGAVFVPDAQRGRLVTVGDCAVQWVVAAESMEWRRVGADGGVRMRSLLLGPDQRSALAAIGGDVRWWSLNDQRHARIHGYGTLDSIALAGGGLIIGGDDEGKVRCWPALDPDRPHDHRSLWSYSEDEPASQRLLRVCDGGRLVVSPRRGRVIVLLAENGTKVTAFEPPARPTAIAVHPDAPVVVLGGRDGSITWWDARSGRSLGRVQAHEGRVQALALARNDLVLSGSRDGTAALWRMHGHALLSRFNPAPEPRPAVPYEQEDPWELGAAAGSADGRHWLIGGHGGQVHVLEWSGSARLVPVRVGCPAWVTGQTDVDGLLDDIRDHRGDVRAAMDAAGALAAPGVLDRLQDSGDESDRKDVVNALEDLMVHGGERAVREVAVVALAAVDRAAATTALYEMFGRHGTDPDGTARRLLAHFTGREEPTIESLIAALPDTDNFLGVLTSEALAERGAAAFPAVHEALRAFPIPAQEHSGTWMKDETTKYRLMHALRGMGADAALATPTLTELLEDDEAYRDTRHQAKTALRAIGLPETADVLAAEILRREEIGDLDDPDGWGCYSLLEVLLEMPHTALAGARKLGDALAAVKRHGDEPEQHMADLVAERLADARATGPAH